MSEKKATVVRNQYVIEGLPNLVEKVSYSQALLNLRKEAGIGGKLADITDEMIDEAKRIAKGTGQEKIYGTSLKKVADNFEKAGKPIGGAQND